MVDLSILVAMWLFTRGYPLKTGTAPEGIAEPQKGEMPTQQPWTRPGKHTKSY